MDFLRGIGKDIIEHYIILGIEGLISLGIAAWGKFKYSWSWPASIIAILFCFAIFLDIFAATLVIKNSTTESIPVAYNYFKTWNVFEPNKIMVIIDTEFLIKLKDEDRIITTCRFNDMKIDELDDTKLLKSELFEITGKDVQIEFMFTKEFLDPFRGKNAHLLCSLSLVPRKIASQEIQNLRQLTNMGGKVLQTVGVGVLTIPTL